MNKEEYEVPMKIMEDLASLYSAKIHTVIDIDYKVCVYITNIDRLKRKKYLCNLEGRGYTYRDACINYIQNILDTKYQIRFKKKYYASTPLRKIVKSNKLYMTKYYKVVSTDA